MHSTGTLATASNARQYPIHVLMEPVLPADYPSAVAWAIVAPNRALASYDPTRVNYDLAAEGLVAAANGRDVVINGVFRSGLT